MSQQNKTRMRLAVALSAARGRRGESVPARTALSADRRPPDEARAFVAESEGVYRRSWTIDDVAENDVGVAARGHDLGHGAAGHAGADERDLLTQGSLLHAPAPRLRG